MGHTKGPWWLDQTDTESFEILGKPDGVIAPIVVSGGFENDEDPQRIVSCVNACEPFADPSVVPELVEALETFCERVEKREIQSKRTYKSFQALIARARGQS